MRLRTTFYLSLIFAVSLVVSLYAQTPLNVLNPASDLSGKTLVTAEGNRSISGTFTYTVPVLFSAGSTATPGIVGSADTTTGLVLSVSSIAASLGGTQRWLLNSSGLTVFGVNVIDNTGSFIGTIASGTLGTGTANNTTVLRGDRTWVALGGTNGQLPIGNGTNYTMGTLTAGSGFGVTNGSGTITLTPNSRVLDKSTTEQDVVNTNVETSVYSYSVPGGTLSTANVLRLTVTGQVAATGVTHTLNIRVKWGGTTIASGAYTMTASTVGGFRVETLINANNATNSQRSEVLYQMPPVGQNVTDGSFAGSAVSVLPAAHSSLAVDSTASQTLQVTFQWDTGDANNHAKRWAAITELLQ